MSALHSTPIISPGTQGQHRQHCPDTDPDHKKGKCISIDADRRVWKCHRCDVGGSLDQPHQLSETERQRLQDKIQSRFKVQVPITDADLATFTIGGSFLEFYKVLYPEVMEPDPKAIRIEFSELKGRRS